jgi:nitroimidazol reductase NimA-like FMN-containing flavoprotein (pyridoxamine 5'-phosphate oxidase superfamily)
VYLKANSKVWGHAVQDYGVTDECDYAYTSFHFKGTVSLIKDLPEKQHAMEVMVRQLSENPEEKLAKTTMGRIDVSYMTGKKHQYPEP